MISITNPSQRYPARAISTGHGIRNAKTREQQKMISQNNSSNLMGHSKQIVNHIQTIVRNRNPAAAQVSSNPYFNQQIYQQTDGSTQRSSNDRYQVGTAHTTINRFGANASSSSATQKNFFTSDRMDQTVKSSSVASNLAQANGRQGLAAGKHH